MSVGQGGIGTGTASGTALDNITGFSGTGLVTRTGAGTYSFTATATFAQSSTTVTGTGALSGGGDLTASRTLDVKANGVDNTRLAQMATVTVKGNVTGSTANPSDVTPSAVLDAAFGPTQGSVLYRGASAWAALGPGTSGQVLQSGGASANPSWQTPTSGSTGDGQCRISIASTTSVLLSPFNGNQLIINGTAQTIPSGGVTGTLSSPANNTVYYVYAYMNGAAMALEFSTTAYTVDGNGRANKTGDTTRRLVGMVLSTSGSVLSDTATFRGCLNWFNRRNLYIDYSISNVTSASTTYGNLISGLVRFLCWADEATSVSAALTGTGTTTSGAGAYVMIDSNAYTGKTLTFQGTSASLNPQLLTNMSEGAHTALVYGASLNTSNSVTWNGDMLATIRG